MLEEGVIEQSRSEWAFPMVLVNKKDGTIRICIDYRKLNIMTQQNAYPMPIVDDILDEIGHHNTGFGDGVLASTSGGDR